MVAIGENGAVIWGRRMGKLVELVREYQATGDLERRTAIAEAIFSEVYWRLWTYISNRCPPDNVEDVMQDTLLAIVQSLHGIKAVADEQVWGFCYRIAARRLADHLRREARMASVVSDAEVFDKVVETYAIEEGLSADEYSQLAEALEVLRKEDPDLHECLWLRYIDGLTYPEIAQLKGANPDTVRMRVDRGIDKLQKRIAKRESLAQHKRK